MAQSSHVGPPVSLEELEADPHAAQARLRATEPVAWIDALNGWLVTAREPALEVMRDAGRFTVDDPRFTTARVVGPSMLSLDGDEHARHREPWLPRFGRGRVHEQLGPVVTRETDRLLDAISDLGRADLRAALAGPLAAAVVGHALELEADPGTVLGWYRAIVDSVQTMTAGGEATAAGRDAFAELAAALDTDAASDAAVILFGGIETTEGMIATALWYLLGEPGGAERALAEPAWLEGAIEESLRLEPAAAMVDRYATTDTTIAGVAVRTGDLVAVSVTAANRDPKTFPAPDRFDPLRSNARRHLAFASGPHVCIGVHLARLEAHTAVRRVLERLPGLALDPERSAAPRGLVFRKPPQLEVTWRPPRSSLRT
ncbi:MAG TPA: cytochrome P450 [Thermoleophilaceae bacterium]|nr:cytochrome P450 [Thermoleophilaceae bacterium]